MVVVTSHFPPDAPSPSVLANFTTFKPSRVAAVAALQPIHDALPPDITLVVQLFCQDSSLADQYAQQTAANPAGHRYCSDDVYMANDEDDAADNIPALLEPAFAALPTPQSAALWFSMAPTSRRGFKGDMALSLQSDHYVSLYAVWKDEADDGRCAAWVGDAMQRLERHSVGSYLGDADFRVRRTKFWSDEAGVRLREVRRKWDPEGRICGFLVDEARDASGIDGLRNEFEWSAAV